MTQAQGASLLSTANSNKEHHSYFLLFCANFCFGHGPVNADVRHPDGKDANTNVWKHSCQPEAEHLDLGCLSAVLFSMFVMFSEREVRDFGQALLIAAIPAAVYGFTFLFRLQFDADTVSHCFLGRIQLSKKPVKELTRVKIGRGVGATLEFLDGTSIRFLGADIRLLSDMCQFIEERWPNQVQLRWNPALSALNDIDKRPRRDA